MISPSNLSTWADRILDSLDETGISNASVVTWMQNNLYRLNLPLGTGFICNSSGYIEPDMNQYESGIYEQQYFCYYYKKKANQFLGAAGYDWTEIRGEEDGSIRRVSRNEVAKTYMQNGKECEVQLKDLINWYIEQDITLVGQILLGDRGDIAAGDQMSYNQPPNQYISDYSTVWRVL
jgi:hypothetical protein